MNSSLADMERWMDDGEKGCTCPAAATHTSNRNVGFHLCKTIIALLGGIHCKRRMRGVGEWHSIGQNTSRVCKKSK